MAHNKPFVAQDLDPGKVVADQFAEVLLHRDAIKKRIEQLADELKPALRGRCVLFVALGTGATYFHSRFTEQKPFETVRWRTVSIHARGYNGTTPGELTHNAESILHSVDGYNDTEVVVLLDEVRHTGQSMAAMRAFFETKFPSRSVLSVCLLDRPDCLLPCHAAPLTLTGFRVSHNRLSRGHSRQGWLVGFGMDVADCYRGLKTVWWTMVEPHERDSRQDRFYKPKVYELPLVNVPDEYGREQPLDEWLLRHCPKEAKKKRHK